MDVREKLVELCEDLEILPCCATYEEQAERRMIMDEVKYYPARMDYPNLCKPYSNADRIRSMSDMELAIHLNIGWECSTCKEQIWIDNKFSLGDCDMNCVGHCLEWLKKPAEETDNETVEEQKDGDD